MSEEQNNVVPIEEAQARFDAGDEKSVRKKTRKVQLTEKQILSALDGIMGVPEGRAFFWWFLGLCRVHNTSFNQNGLTMAFNEGARNVGLQVEAMLVRASMEKFVMMQKEAIEREQDNAA